MKAECGCTVRIEGDVHGMMLDLNTAKLDEIVFCGKHGDVRALVKALTKIVNYADTNGHPVHKVTRMNQIAKAALAANAEKRAEAR